MKRTILLHVLLLRVVLLVLRELLLPLLLLLLLEVLLRWKLLLLAGWEGPLWGLRCRSVMWELAGCGLLRCHGG